MRRLASSALDLREPPPRRRGRRLLLMLVALVVAPFAIDLISIIRVHWSLMCGVRYDPISTPAFDWVGDLATSVRRSTWGFVGRQLFDAPLRPIPTILFGLGWAFGIGLLLRGSKRR